MSTGSNEGATEEVAHWTLIQQGGNKKEQTERASGSKDVKVKESHELEEEYKHLLAMQTQVADRRDTLRQFLSQPVTTYIPLMVEMQRKEEAAATAAATATEAEYCRKPK